VNNAAAMYGKSHAQITKSYDKPGFHQTGTPPPFNLAGPQPGALGASAYGAPYIMPHTQQSMLHHQDDPRGNAGVGAQRSIHNKTSTGGQSGQKHYNYNWAN